MAVPQTAVPLLQTTAGRGSLEVPRSEGVTPGGSSPEESRRGSALISGGAEGVGPGGSPLNREELQQRERVKAEARIAGLKNSLVDLTSYSTTTTRRLDESYYSVLQKLTTLQNTIVALQDLAKASNATSAGFITESQSVLAEAQSQLDAFGDFSEQQGRVQALQDRVHGARERIEALSERVDVVKRRVERWERAWAQSWESARRVMRIVWGVLLGLGLVLLVLYLGARAYGPEIEGAVVEPKEEAVAAKVKLEHSTFGAGPDRAREGDGKNGSLPLLDFTRDREVELAGDEAIRALDEL